ncbi:MAG: hypothetical protein GY726_07785 [Proteobacteria bacterium]|nr:hypothetical protein [Pseudomonadota bacterium]
MSGCAGPEMLTKNIDKYDLLAILLITSVVALVFGQTGSHQLIGYDDPYFISLVPEVTSGLSWENTRWAWSTSQMSIWHPLTWFSFQLESELFGAENDGARFLLNTLLHLLNTLLVYLLGKKLGFGKDLALILSLLFALHPQHVEVVAWVSERKELLATGFVLLSVWQYLVHRKTQTNTSYYLSLGFFVLALLSKASAAPLAALLPVAHYIDTRFSAPGKKPSEHGLFKIFTKWLPFLIAASLISIVTINMQAAALSEKLFDFDSSLNYLLMIGVRFAWYLEMSFWPSPIFLFHAAPDSLSGFNVAVSALEIVLFLWVVWRFRSNHLFLIGISWFILFLAPTSGIVPVESIFVANRYSYQAHIGLFIALLAMTRNVAPGPAAAGIRILFFVVITIFSLISWQQTAVWKDSVSLFENEMHYNPSNEGASIQLGYAYFDRENHTLARRYFKQAIALKPDGFYGYAYLGFLEEAQGNLEQAKDLYLEAIRNADPDPYQYHHVQDVYGHLVWVHSTLKKHSLAIGYLKQGLAHFPDSSYLMEMQQYYEQHYEALSKTPL